MNERIEISKLMLYNGQAKIINKNAEIYGACRHKAKFHVFEQATPIPGTDEGETQKKKQDEALHKVSDSE